MIALVEIGTPNAATARLLQRQGRRVLDRLLLDLRRMGTISVMMGMRRKLRIMRIRRIRIVIRRRIGCIDFVVVVVVVVMILIPSAAVAVAVVVRSPVVTMVVVVANAGAGAVVGT